MSNETLTMMQKFNKLEQIKNELSTSKPDLDTLMPKFELTNELEKDLKEFFSGTKKILEQKRKEREMENNQ